MVYYQAFSSPELPPEYVQDPCLGRRGAYGRGPKVFTWRPYQGPSVQYPTDPAVQLLTTCKLVHEEGLDVLYKKIFCFTSPRKIREFNEVPEMVNRFADGKSDYPNALIYQQPEVRTQHITRLALVFRAYDNPHRPIQQHLWVGEILKSAETWASGLVPFSFFHTRTSLSRLGEWTVESHAATLCPNVTYLELDFSAWKLEYCWVPRVLLDAIKATRWKLDTLKFMGLGTSDQHLEAMEELEQALLKNPPPRDPGRYFRSMRAILGIE